jgi:hypothetical protein
MDLLESRIAGELPLYLLDDLLIDLFCGLSHNFLQLLIAARPVW